MAVIETNSYKDYKEFKDWSDTQFLTFFDGYKIRIGNFVFNRNEDDFSENEITIINAPAYVDIYLIQNCKFDFVINVLSDVYDEEDFNVYKNFDFNKGFHEDYKQNRKITIQKTKVTKFPIHKKPYNGSNWWLQSDDNFWYNEDRKLWIHLDMEYPTDCNTAHLPTIKSVVRHLRKQYLPKGITFTLFGRYIGEDYIIKIN